MSITSHHPYYDAFHHQWKVVRDFYAGEAWIKSLGEEYLPATEGMHLDGMNPGATRGTGDIGWRRYEAYRMRARVPDYVEMSVEILLGLLNQKGPVIKLPAAMEPMRKNATVNGESLEKLLLRIHLQQLITGRCGLLADLPSGVSTGTLPYLALYNAESIINWDDNSEQTDFSSLNLLVLNESALERVDFEWRKVNKFRVCKIGDLSDADIPTGEYRQAVFSSDNNSIEYDPTQMIAPSFRGKTLSAVPFVFINTKDNLATPDKAPLLRLARECHAIYMAEADYRQHLHMQAQETLVVKGGTLSTSPAGGTEPLRTGAGARIDVDINGDAKYIGVGSEGLSEQRIAIAADRQRASVRTGELIQSMGSQKESGEALQTRYTAQTATLNQIAATAAAGLEQALRMVANWMGANPEEVVVTPNTEFVNFEIDGLNLINLMQAKQQGMPLSYDSIHGLLADRGLTNKDFETELQTIMQENQNIKDVLTPAPANPAGVTGPNPRDPGSQQPRNGSGA